MAEFEVFHIIYLIAISAITVIFLVHTILTRQELTMKEVTFDEYFRHWLDHHDVETPPDEVKGPLKPYLHAFFIAGKWYVRLGINANKLSVLGFIWALWSLECWFLGNVWIFLGFFFLILSSTTDSLDGAVAYLTDSESKLGAYYDAVLDKFGDILWVVGPIYFLFTNPIVLGTYSNFWLITILTIGLLGLLFAIIQEYCRARQQGLGVEETAPVVGERISRFGCLGTITASIGISNLAIWISPSPGFITVNIWIKTYIIPLMFISLLALAIVSLIQTNRHAVKHLK